MDIVSELMKQVGTGDNLSLISSSVGGDEKGVPSALGMGLPVIMGALSNSAHYQALRVTERQWLYGIHRRTRCEGGCEKRERAACR